MKKSNQSHKPPFQQSPNKGNNVSTIKSNIIAQSFEGPIPHPEILAVYNQIIPDGADRILKLAESETAHRQAMEKKAVNAEIEGLKNEALDTRRGQIFGLIIGVTTVISGTVCAVYGASIPAVFIGTSGVVGLVSAFIIGRRKNVHQSDKNNKELAPMKEQK